MSPEATFNFPRGFLWGTATSSHQVEGNNRNNNWWYWEHEPGHIIDGSKSGLACDWWGGRWREDLDRAAETSQNAHRLSIEWSRIQIKPDKWDEHALDYYREILRGLRDRNLVPIITLQHFSEPIWLAESGGWENEQAVDHFENYVTKTVEAIKEYTNLWVTINEPNVALVNGYLFRLFPPGKKDLRSVQKAAINMARSHARGYHAIHRLQPDARVGIAHNYHGMIPYRKWFPMDLLVTELASRLFNDTFPRLAQDGVLRFFGVNKRITHAENTQDFLGINYYTRQLLQFNFRQSPGFYLRRFHSPEDEVGDTGFIANAPEFFTNAIRWGKRFNLPIIITENGIENRDDQIRRRYLVKHIHKLWRAVNFNIPIKGYLHWTLVDNFEWERGWTQRFGLWELDPLTQTRTKRPSADLYAGICATNSLSSDIVARFTPEIYDDIFPS